ncbi:hypothetical protein D3C71_1218660 [compost metagenome]
MGDHCSCRAAFSGRHLPDARGSVDQHRTGCSACLSQWEIEGADRRRSAGDLALKDRLVVGRRIGRRQRDLNLVEADFELFGEKHRLGCRDPLPHFSARDDQNDLTVGAHAYEAVRDETVKAGRGCVEGASLTEVGRRYQCARRVGECKSDHEGAASEKFPAPGRWKPLVVKKTKKTHVRPP